MSSIVPERETLTVEFKSDIKKYSNAALFEDVVAFANTEGGDLYLGVEDDGTVSGVHPEHANPLTLGAFIASNTVPPISTHCEVIGADLPVLKITVHKCAGGIVATRSGKILRRRLKIDGTPENVPMYPTEIATRLSDLRLLDYSAMTVFEGSLDDIDPLELDRLRRAILAYDGDKSLLELDDTELLRALGFSREQNGVDYPTIAGILMVGKTSSLRRFVPTVTSSFQVLEGTSVRVNNEYVLPVLSAIEKIIDLSETWNPERELELGIYRMPAPEFDRRALREAVVNAFCHRDYSVLGCVRVAISDEGLTIANPGGFIEGITIQNLLTAEPRGRNQMLADALKRCGLAEKTGRGIDRIFAGSLIYGRSTPDYSLTMPTTVTVFIPRSQPNLHITQIIATEQRRLGRPLSIASLFVLNTLHNRPRSTERQIAEATTLSQSVVKITLERLIASGLVEYADSGKKWRYSLAHHSIPESEHAVWGNAQKESNNANPQYRNIANTPDAILNLARNKEFITRADVMNLLQVNEGKAYNLLKKLVIQGKLTPVHKGRYAKYKVTN